MQSVFLAGSNTVVIKRLMIADRFLTRLKGLMFSKSLLPDSGLLITPCQQVHTHFMRYPIDVIFVSRQHQVLHIERQMRPWRFSRFYKQAHYVLELNAGLAKAVNIGDTLERR